MRVLDLFSGTHSVGKVCAELGYECISLDLKDADINVDILEWDYTIYPPNHFNIIWASPECLTFSKLRRSWIGRKLKAFGDVTVTAEMLYNDMIDNGLPLLRKTEEIINYFNPNVWFMENPASSKMKDYTIFKNKAIFDYCMFGFEYQKSTAIWSNKELDDIRCDKSHLIDNKHRQILGVKESRQTQKTKYRVPPDLIKHLLSIK